MADFSIRAVEVHSSYAWDFRWMMKVLNFAERNGLNALVIHRNDAVEQVVYPGVQFGAEEGSCRNIFERYRNVYRKLYRYTPTRRSGPLLRREYLKRLTEVAKRRGIAVYLENKELSFPDVLLELFPQLTKDGHGCPTEPFWWEYIRIKYEELFQDIPDIAGIITSVGTGESRISITSNRCTCERCQKTTPEMWYRQVLDVMYGVLSVRGKRLVVRDFVFNRKAHEELAAGFETLPPDVGVAIKDTPHDYYPTFPQNGLIEKLTNREKWIEYDTMGQYFGWGIGPSTMVEYMKERMTAASRNGATAVIFRTDWESLDGHTAFDTPNILNLYAGAVFSTALDAPSETVYLRWLEDSAAFSEDCGQEEKERLAKRTAEVFSGNWEVIRRSLYVQDCVFNDCSTFPVGYDQATWLAEEKNSLKDWVPEKRDALSPTEENTLRILSEKDEAIERVERLVEQVRELCEEFSGAFARDLAKRYDIFALYTAGFAAVTKLYALVRFAVQSKQSAAPIAGVTASSLISKTLSKVDEVIAGYERFALETEESHSVYQLLSPERLGSFRDDIAAVYERLVKEGSRV